MVYIVDHDAGTRVKGTEAMHSESESIIRCRDCAWFAPVESCPEAAELHRKLIMLFEDCLEKREGKRGVCRKVTFSKERPVLTNEHGYCHRAERKEQQDDA